MSVHEFERFFGDWVFRAGVGWNTHVPIWRMPLHHWWHYPITFRQWGATIVLWPVSFWLHWSHNPRWWRQMTPVQRHFIVYTAVRAELESMAKEEVETTTAWRQKDRAG